MAGQLQFRAGHYRLTRGADVDDRDPTALLVAAAELVTSMHGARS
jgi:hypothetical protein